MSNIHSVQELMQSAHISPEPAAAASSVPLSDRVGGQPSGFAPRVAASVVSVAEEKLMEGVPPLVAVAGADDESAARMRHHGIDPVERAKAFDRAMESDESDGGKSKVSQQRRAALRAAALRREEDEDNELSSAGEEMIDHEPEREAKGSDLAEVMESSGYNDMLRHMSMSHHASRGAAASSRLSKKETAEDRDRDHEKSDDHHDRVARAYVMKIRNVLVAINELEEMDVAPNVSEKVGKDKMIETPTNAGLAIARRVSKAACDAANVQLINLNAALHKYSQLFNTACEKEYAMQHYRSQLRSAEATATEDEQYAMDKRERRKQEKREEGLRKLNKEERRNNNKRKKLGTDETKAPSIFDRYE